VDAGFDEDKAELGVFVLAVALEVLADGHGLRQSMRTQARNFFSSSLNGIFGQLSMVVGTYLFDQHVEVLRDVGC
jgi:hypothetical protein